MKKFTTPLVLVQWLDACSRPIEVEDIKSIVDSDLGCLQNTVGYLVHKSHKWIVLAADWGVDNNQYRDLFEIPRSLVKKIRYLK